MKSSKQLKEERALITNKIDELKKVDNISEAQTAELRSLIAQEDSLTEAIETALELEKREAKKVGKQFAEPDPEKREMQRFSISKMISEYDEKRGIEGVTGFEREMLEESAKEARSLGVVTAGGAYLSSKLMGAIASEKRTMTANVAADGGNLIPTDKIEWFDALFDKTVLGELGVQVLSGLSANTDLPGFSSAVVSGWANGETGTQSPDDPTVVSRSLRPKLLYGATNISKRLAIQTNRSVDQMVMMDIMASIAQTLQRAVFNGSGSSGEPTGILNTASIQSVAMGNNGAAISFAKVMELWKAIATANCNLDNYKWVTNPKVFANMLQTSTDTGSGNMIVSYNNAFGALSKSIAGYPVSVSASIPDTLTKNSSGAVCSALIAGDFSQVVVGQFGGVEVVVDPYTNARSGFTALTVNQYVDVVVKQPAALGAIADILAN